MEEKKKRPSLLLSVVLPRNHDLLGPLRDLAGALCKARYTALVAQRVGLAAHELTENALLYGSLSEDVLLEIRVDNEGRTIGIAVTNTTTPIRVRTLVEHVARLRQKGTSADALAEMMTLSAKAGTRSQLGLARVQHEARMELTVDSLGDRVRIEARGRL
jgi:hypothetical protein